MVKFTIVALLLLVPLRFLFIATLTVPFNISDLFQDKQSGLKTVPTVWGEKNAYLFCQVLLAGYIVLLFLFEDSGLNRDFWALTLTALLTGWLIFKSRREKNEYYYFFYLDGVLILQFVLLVVFRMV